MKITTDEATVLPLAKKPLAPVNLIEDEPERIVRDPITLAVLKLLLEYSRVKTIGGWKKGRCKSCDVPHLQYRICPCPHHAALRLLSESGITVEGM